MFDPYWIHDDLRAQATSHVDVKMSEVQEFEELFSSGCDENACQDYLQRHPAILAAYGRSGHGEWVLDRPRLGDRYIPDFIIGHGHSGGYFWTLIELESPRQKPFNKDGTFSSSLRKAIDQIDCWRIWLEQNLDFAQRPRSRGGIGLVDIRPRAPGKIIIGRRGNFPPHFNELRRKAQDEKFIDIMSYDRFLNAARSQAEFWDKPVSPNGFRFDFDGVDLQGG